MKTVVTTKIKTEISNLQFGYWDDEQEEFIPVECTKNSIEQAAKALDCPERLVGALEVFASMIRDYVSMDLIDIWKRLDDLDK